MTRPIASTPGRCSTIAIIWSRVRITRSPGAGCRRCSRCVKNPGSITRVTGAPRLKAVAAAHGFVPIVRHRATDMAQVKRLVISGLGSAFIPRPRDDERLCALTFSDVEVRRDVVLGAVSGRKRGIAADAFVRASRARSWAAAAA